MSDINIHGIFPTPVFEKHLNRVFTKKEIDFVDKQQHKCVKNLGNIYTKDKYILNKKELKYIKKFIEQSCNEYLINVLNPKKNIELYVTQSWINYTNKQGYHKPHTHQNSFISGVFYFKANEINDKITFYKNEHPFIANQPKQFNVFNSTSWWVSVKPAQLLMFPSSLMHGVDLKEDDSERISLAFNTFLKGSLGHNDDLNELIL